MKFITQVQGHPGATSDGGSQELGSRARHSSGVPAAVLLTPLVATLSGNKMSKSLASPGSVCPLSIGQQGINSVSNQNPVSLRVRDVARINGCSGEWSPSPGSPGVPAGLFANDCLFWRFLEIA